MINKRKSLICGKGIEEAFKNKEMDLVVITGAYSAYMKSEYIIVATLINYDSELNFFDTFSVEVIIDEALSVTPAINIVIN